jgi:IS4 transposase
VHEVNIARGLTFPKGSIVVIDRGYIDYALFGKWGEEGMCFVTRQKDNADYKVGRDNPVPKGRNILRDQVIELRGYYSEQDCPHKLRRIEVVDEENKRVIVLLTNHLELGATTIASIYKDIWQIEIFFKVIKQNLRIKTFVGTSPNALMTQIWTALSSSSLTLSRLKNFLTSWMPMNLVRFFPVISTRISLSDVAFCGEEYPNVSFTFKVTS